VIVYLDSIRAHELVV